MVPGKGDRGRGARWATRGAGRSGGDGRPPRPAGQVPGRWGREGRLTGFRWPEGWECERCGCATCPPAAGSVPCGCWRDRRGARPPPGSPPRSGSRRTWRPSCRGARAAPWRGRGASDAPSGGGGAGADDFLVAARDRTRRRGRARSTDTRPMLAADGRASGRRGRRSPGVVPPRSRRGPRRVPELDDGAGIAMVEFSEGPCREPSPLLAVHVVFLPVPSWSKIPTAVPTTFVYIIIDKRIASVIHPNAFQM